MTLTTPHPPLRKHDCMLIGTPSCAQATHLRPLLVGDNSTGGRYCQFRLKTAPWATGWRATMNLRLGADDADSDNQGACGQALTQKKCFWPVHRRTEPLSLCKKYNVQPDCLL